MNTGGIKKRSVSVIAAGSGVGRSKLAWDTEFPTETGWYWFWGHRYGLNGVGELSDEPELCPVRVVKCPNHMMYVADGQFMYKSEVLYPHFKKMDVPEYVPEIDYKPEHVV